MAKWNKILLTCGIIFVVVFTAKAGKSDFLKFITYIALLSNKKIT